MKKKKDERTDWWFPGCHFRITLCTQGSTDPMTRWYHYGRKWYPKSWTFIIGTEKKNCWVIAFCANNRQSTTIVKTSTTSTKRYRQFLAITWSSPDHHLRSNFIIQNEKKKKTSSKNAFFRSVGPKIMRRTSSANMKKMYGRTDGISYRNAHTHQSVAYRHKSL